MDFLLSNKHKSIKFLSLSLSEKDERNEEFENFWKILKERVISADFEDIKNTFANIFQYAAKVHQTNPSLLDIVLRKLVGCIEQREKSRQVLSILLENSLNISYNFHHEVDGVTFEKFLKDAIEEILSKKKRLKVSDYNSVTAIAKLNPSIVEDSTQKLLEKILFERHTSEADKIANENLTQELWTASVRLRRHQKFISRFLLTISSYAANEVETPDSVEVYKLSAGFINGVKNDFKHRTTSSQILAILITLNYHLKTDCIDSLITQNSAKICISLEMISFFLCALLEHCNFLDSGLPHDWKLKFFNAISDLRNNLSSLTNGLCLNANGFERRLFLALHSMVKIWSECYDLLQFYECDVASTTLEFPILDSHLKKMKKQLEKLQDHECKDTLGHILLIKSIIHNKGEPESLDNEAMRQLWDVILEDHFQIIDTLNEDQVSMIASSVVNDACNTGNRNSKWSLFFKKNDFRISKTLAASLAFKTLHDVVDHSHLSCSQITVDQFTQKETSTTWNNKELKNFLKNVEKKIVNKKHNSDCSRLAAAQKLEENLKFLSCLPLSFLDPYTRLVLFLNLYFIEKETRLNCDPKDSTSYIYLDFLRQNDINILDWVTMPYALIEHFKNNVAVLSRICKLSLNNSDNLPFWEEFIDQEACNQRIIPILLNCADFSKSKTSSSDERALKLKLFTKLSKKFIKYLEEELANPHEIAALRTCLKLTLANGKKIKDKLKKCVEKSLSLDSKSIATTNKDEFISEILKLSCVALQHRENFEFNNEVVKKLCTLSIDNPDVKILNHFLDTLKDREFDYFATVLGKRTVDALISGNKEILEKLSLIWECLSKAEMKGVRLKTLTTSVNYIFDNLLGADIEKSSSVFVLRIFRAFIKSKRTVAPSEKVIDSIFVVSSECLNELNADSKLITCQEAIGLCIDFLRSKTDLILDRLHVLTDIFRQVLLIILEEGKSSTMSDEGELRILAVDIEKFCTFFAKLKKHVGRISPYLIADMIDASTRAGVLPRFLKTSIESSICHLLVNCDRYAISFLSRTLPTSTQQVFKTTYDNYKKYSKFTGKI